jgi:hypothetical protein
VRKQLSSLARSPNVFLTGTRTRAFQILALAAIGFARASAPSIAQSPQPLASPTAVPDTPLPAPSPTSIGGYWYDKAYDHWRSLPREHFATYDTDLVYTFKGKRKERKQHVAFRYHDGRCLIVGIPIDSRDRPDKTQITDRCFGPDFSFAFVQQRLGGFKNAPIEIPTIAPTDAPTAQASGEPKTIASVKTRARPYDVTFVGYEQKDGKNTIHLSLVANIHPADHLLTDMWIDPTTSGVVHLRAEAVVGRIARLTFEASYDEDANSQTLTSVVGYAKGQVLLIRIGLDFTYRQSNIAYPDTLPDWYFDQTAYDEHQRAKDGR